MKNLDDGPDGLNDEAFDRMLGVKRTRTRRTTKLPADWRPVVVVVPGPTRPQPSKAMIAESRTVTVRMEVL